MAYIVHFVSSVTGTSFKVGTYKSKKAIRNAQEKYSLQYGAHLGLTILEKETLKEFHIWEIK
jgi:hypothetical protein